MIEEVEHTHYHLVAVAVGNSTAVVEEVAFAGRRDAVAAVDDHLERGACWESIGLAWWKG